jgi:uncharacterized protein YdhG (YjbR/CyaY superfamily)
MANTGFKSVDEYIASQPEPLQAILHRVRRAIRKTLPDADEVISYQMPAFKLHGRAVIDFAGWKQHYSLYPATGPLVAALRDELAPHQAGKGTIRFPLSGPVPVRLIQRIAKFRARGIAAPSGSKVAAARKR